MSDKTTEAKSRVADVPPDKLAKLVELRTQLQSTDEIDLRAALVTLLDVVLQ